MQLADRRLRLNLSAYHYDYSDLQVVSVSPQTSGGLPTTALHNAASASIDGFEVETIADIAKGFEVSATLGFMKAEYDDFPDAAVDPLTGDVIAYSGNRLPQAPKFTGSLAADYSVPVSAALATRFHADYSYLGKQYYNSAQSELVSSGSGYGVMNARVGIGAADDRWGASIWMRNIGNKKYITEATDWSFQGSTGRYFGELRTYGVNFIYQFAK
jgi:iron complex outermembrane receptor protein